jgi:hypothetical protein
MRITSLAALAVLAAVSAAQAQVPDHAVGLGVSLSPSALVDMSSQTTLVLPVGFGNIYLPIIAGPNFKIEPEFGIWRTSSSTDYSGSSASFSGTLLRVGAGLFRFVRVGGGTALYVGPRVAMVRSSDSQTSSGITSSSHQTDWSFGLAIGGEHFFSPHFSLGGEVQLNYISVGTEEQTPPPTFQPSVSSSMITNNGLIFIRLYR